MRQRPRRAGARWPAAGCGASRLSSEDDLVRPALEAALQLASAGQLRSPPDEVPRALAPFVRFQRLPERALGQVRRVLDTDETFRHRLADIADEAALGRASWLFVTRPEGWEDELAALRADADRSRAAVDEERAVAGLTRRLGETEAALDRVSSERDQLAADVVDLRARVAEERRLRHRVETDAGRLRQRVAGLEAERDEARSDDALLARITTLEQSLEEQRRRLLEREAAESAQPPPPDLGPVVDAASDAVATAVAAMSVVAAELEAARQALGPPRERRAVARVSDGAGDAPPGGRRPVVLPPAVFDDGEEAAGFLVRVRGVTVLVDGYNVTKLARPEMELAAQRQWLADTARGLAARTGADIQLVFDGAGVSGAAPAEHSSRHGVQVRFSPEGVEADDVLIDLVGLLPVERPVVVATNDRRVREACRLAGANVISSDQLLAVLGVTPRR